jgi:ATP-binding cassette subfamily B protein
VDKAYFVPFGSNKPTIRGISFEIMPGDCVGVIGPSGSGKSTLTKLLVGVWQAGSGALKLDGADVYTYNREHFGKYIGYVPQDIELFNTSVKSNIARLSDEVDPNKVVKSAKIAGVHDLILSLPNGYDTIIGPGGVTLSGGQKQRIALARAFYGDIRVLVLDEPNSNLDQAGEQSLVNAIQYAKHMKITVIFTTHKLNMISITNKLLLMQDGMIGAFGDTQQVVDGLQKQQAPASSAGQQQANAAHNAAHANANSAGTSTQNAQYPSNANQSENIGDQQHARSEDSVSVKNAQDNVQASARFQTASLQQQQEQQPVEER